MSLKQFLKFSLCFAVSFLTCYALLRLSDGSVLSFLEKIITVFPFMVTGLMGLTFLLFTYVDNISKEVTELRNEVDRKSFNLVIDKLSTLKKEVLYNAGLMLFLLILEVVVKGGADYLSTRLPFEDQIDISIISISCRAAFFVISLWAAMIQFQGFLISVELRDVIAKNRK